MTINFIIESTTIDDFFQKDRKGVVDIINHVDKKVDFSESIPRIFYNRPKIRFDSRHYKGGANRTQNKTQFSSVILQKALPLVLLYLTNIPID